MLRKDNTCSTCGKNPQLPYQRIDKNGNILERCCDECHNPYIAPCSNAYSFVQKFKKNHKPDRI